MSVVFISSTPFPLVSSAFLLPKVVVATTGVHLNEVKHFAKVSLEVGTWGYLMWCWCGVLRAQMPCDFYVLDWPPPSQVSVEWGPDCNRFGFGWHL